MPTRRRFGSTDLQVSPLCLGANVFGWTCDEEQSFAVLDAYVEAGGNFIDTANGYTKGHSEVIIGDYLARTPGRRDRIVLATKFSSNLFLGDPNAGGASRKNIMASCDESLRRLKTDYIDLYWMHFWGTGGQEVPAEVSRARDQAIEALKELRDGGRTLDTDTAPTSNTGVKSVSMS